MMAATTSNPRLLAFLKAWGKSSDSTWMIKGSVAKANSTDFEGS